MISIIIPLYNKEGSIARTLQTVFNQTCQDFEIVVVDDGSTDKSIDVVKGINDSRIRLISQKNQGVSVARNVGIQEAKYDYIALIDADDEWLPCYLENQVELIKKHPDCQIYASKYEVHDEEGVKPIVLNGIPFKEESGVLSNYFEVATYSSPPLWTSAVCFTKKAIQSVGGFPKGIKLGEDLITWAKLACKYKIAYSLQVLAVYNIESFKQNTVPGKAPDVDDHVGVELSKLSKDPENAENKFLRKYVALWYKMRLNMYVRLGMKKEGYDAFLKSVRYNPFEAKIYIWLLLNILPRFLREKILYRLAALK
ncbi:MAG: glycosyltransferase family 2 protein [Candidatus Azobacteroides sp.]|nr:glycosyltransferase family 2 protein [Candidatus Azobacteroides sp.]